MSAPGTMKLNGSAEIRCWNRSDGNILQVDDQPQPMSYVQTFHLQLDGASYFVHNDIFRCMWAFISHMVGNCSNGIYSGVCSLRLMDSLLA